MTKLTLLAQYMGMTMELAEAVHRYQPIRDVSRAVPDLDELEDTGDYGFFQMLDELIGKQDNDLTHDVLAGVAETVNKYKGDPAWDKFITAIFAGPDMESDLEPCDQLLALIKALPKNEQEAGQTLAKYISGTE